MATNIEQKLTEMGLEMPVLPTSKGIYQRCLTVGNLVYFSGHISVVSISLKLTRLFHSKLTHPEARITRERQS